MVHKRSHAAIALYGLKCPLCEALPFACTSELHTQEYMSRSTKLVSDSQRREGGPPPNLPSVHDTTYLRAP